MSAMTLGAPPTGERRLLGTPPTGPVPRLDAGALVDLLAAAGLTGRGGAGFPTAKKVFALQGRSPVVVGNAMEGEPLSHKDAVLMQHSPSLVLDGLELVAQAVGARRTILALGSRVPAPPARPGVEVHRLRDSFVAGQETALVNQLNGHDPVPTDPSVPVFRRGVDGRPTLVLNAETYAQIALLARYGAAWFRSQGQPDDPGTFLVSLTASRSDLLVRPGVIEVRRGIPLTELLHRGGADADRVQAVLVGGYHGAWIDPSVASMVTIARESLEAHKATLGAKEAVTGPARRGDIRTIAQHLDRLTSDPDLRRAYAVLSDLILRTYHPEKRAPQDL